MELGLKGRVALVTGSSRGLGKAIALTLAQEGVDIIVCGRDQQALAQSKKEIEQYGVRCFAHVFDAQKPGEIKALFAHTVERIGRLDILVNNLGGDRGFVSFFEATDEYWQTVFEINLMSTVRFTRQAIPWLKKSDQARIINFSSVAGKRPGYINPHYGAIKAAVINLSKHLSNALATDNILVNVICPSNISGDAWERSVADKATRNNISADQARQLLEQEVLRKTPLGLGSPEDVANMVAFLASKQANFITGACVMVDGGVIKTIF